MKAPKINHLGGYALLVAPSIFKISLWEGISISGATARSGDQDVCLVTLRFPRSSVCRLCADMPLPKILKNKIQPIVSQSVAHDFPPIPRSIDSVRPSTQDLIRISSSPLPSGTSSTCQLLRKISSTNSDTRPPLPSTSRSSHPSPYL